MRKLLALAVTASLFTAGQASAAPPATPSGTQAAQPVPATPDQARADARQRLSEGLDRYSRGDYDGARLAFQQAYAVLASVDLLYNLARAEVKSGHSLEALVHVRQILRDPKATVDDHTKAARLLDDANRNTAHIAIDAPAGAEIVIDHVPSGESPSPEVFDVSPGRHVCEARANGQSRIIEVVASVGDVVTARFALDAARPPTVSAPVPMPMPASTPEAPPPPPPSTEPARVDYEEHHDSKARIIVPVVIGAVAVVALGVGIGFGASSKSKKDDATDFRANNPQGFCAVQTSSTCQQYASLLDSQQHATNLERGFLIGGAVLAVGSVVTAVAWPHKRTRDAASIGIVPVAGGLGLGGSF